MKTKLLLFALLFMASTSISWAQIPGIAVGTGTDVDPYKIGTASELVAFRTAVNAAAGTVAAVASYELTANIDMANEPNFYGIGVGGNTFNGKFDGKGFKISGLNAGSESSPVDGGNSINTGFFGSVTGATIKNLTVEVAYYFASTSSSANNGTLCGGLVGSVSGATVIDNCKVTGTISSETTDAVIVGTATAVVPGRATTGGLVGTVGANNTTVYIINSSVNATLSAKNSYNAGIVTTPTSLTGAPTYCAGIVGAVANSAGMMLKIINCSAAGSVSAISIGNNSWAAGITTYAYAPNPTVEIFNCIVSNTITSTGVYKTGYNGTPAAGIAQVQNSNCMIKYCMALNPKISAINSAEALSGGTAINRIWTTGAITLTDFNYAKSDMILEKTLNGVLTTVTPTAASVTGRDGADLGDDPVAEATTKLNEYVTANPTINSIALRTWTAGMLNQTVVSALNKLELKPINYSIANGNLKVSGIEGSKQLSIYNISGAVCKQLTVTDSYSTSLAKGIYMLKVEGLAPSKLVVY